MEEIGGSWESVLGPEEHVCKAATYEKEGYCGLLLCIAPSRCGEAADGLESGLGWGRTKRFCLFGEVQYSSCTPGSGGFQESAPLSHEGFMCDSEKG